MNVAEKIQAVLVAAAGVTAIAPAARIRYGFLGQDVERPCISHFEVAGQETRTHSGRATLQFWPFYQVSCFGDSAEDAKKLAVAVIAALGSYRSGGLHVIGARQGGYLYDDTVQVHHVPVELELAESL